MILDCTLRDGGYYTNWSFDNVFVQNLITGLLDSNVDIIELGYKSPSKGGVYKKCNDGFLKTIVPRSDRYAFMLDVKDFVTDGNLNLSQLDECVKDKDLFTYVRVAIKQDEIEYVPLLHERLISKGYKVFVNIMNVFEIPEDRLKHICKVLEGLNLEAVYFADSFGNLRSKDIRNLVSLLKCYDFDLGFHGHDNQGLAFANALYCLDLGVKYLDSTVMGMGRGVGNLKTEQLLLNNRAHYTSLFNFIDSHMYELWKKYKWGFSLTYMQASLKNVHPLVSQRIQSSDISTTSKLSLIDRYEGVKTYDKKKIDRELDSLTSCIIIPARFKSSRFPGKPLAKINGREMILRVCDIASKAVPKEDVYVATENKSIFKLVTDNGYKCIMTSDECLTGTDRVAEASKEVDYDIYINLQGDEPAVNPDDIKKLIEFKKNNFGSVVNCMTEITDTKDIVKKSVPKVVVSEDNSLLYMSRAPIPSSKGESPKGMKQVCIYAFNKNELDKFWSEVKTKNEQHEDIEILRFLDKGIGVKMLKVSSSSIAVDYPEDIKAVEKL